MATPRVSALAASSVALLLSGCLLGPPGDPPPAASPQASAAPSPPPSTASAPGPDPSATAAPSAPGAAATQEPAPAADRLPKVQPPEDTAQLVFTHHQAKDRLSIYVPAGASVKEAGLSDDTIVAQGKEILDIGAGLEDVKALKGIVADLEHRKKGARLQEDDFGILWREGTGKKARYFFSWNIDVGGIDMKHRCRSTHPLETQAEAERLLAMCRTLRWQK